MNLYQIKLLCFVLTNLSIIKAVSTIQQGKVEQWISRQVTLPIQLHYGVPYLELSLLCSAQIKQEVSGNKHLFDLRRWSDEQDSQFQEISNFYQQSDVTVLLDTGSSQFWLADSTCSNCHSKKSLCPHLLTSEKKISYVKGYIEGVDSYINLCGNRMKFLCVKAAQGLGRIAFQGIMGLKKESLGFNMLFTILKKGKTKNLNNQQYSSKLSSRNYIILHKQQIKFTFSGLINQLKIKVSKFAYQKNYQILNIDYPFQNDIKIKQITCDQNWSFKIKQISLFNDTIIIDQSQFPGKLAEQKEVNSQKKNKLNQKNKRQIKAFVDTGSTKIVASNSLCQQIINKAYQKLNIQCRYQQGQGIDCNKIIKGLNFKIGISFQQRFNQVQQEKNLSIEIMDEYLIDQLSNRINIICQPPQNEKSTTQTSQNIILGYPFLKSHETTFVIQSIAMKENKQGQEKDKTKYKIRLQPYPQQKIDNQSLVIKVMVVLYLFSVGLLSWVTMIVIDFVRDKRSKKIII